jgi:hypothetical protein
LLSAAPGFFVDHEISEGLGNDVYLRGFDLDHGSGIEMAVGGVALNQPIHIQGQGYVDVNFVIPELVNTVHVLQGTYDPRQGDAAIVGSAFFDLAMPERGYHLATSYGSFAEKRLLAIAAPRQASDETFVALAARDSEGFGQRRASRSGVVNAQLGTELGPYDHLRVLGVGYIARANLAGVVREDDVNAGRIGYYDSYPFWSQHQIANSDRILLNAEWQHVTHAGERLSVTGFGMRSGFLTRQNFAGAFETSQLNPNITGRGDLFERDNREVAFGLQSAFKANEVKLGNVARLLLEPGVGFRRGHTEQSRRLLTPDTLQEWDRRDDASVSTLDVNAYFDVNARILDRFRISGGPRVDVLSVSVADHLAALRRESGVDPRRLPEAQRAALGVVISPRITAEYEPHETIAFSLAYGEGFRSLDAASLKDGTHKPYSKVRSVEVGMRSRDRSRGYRATVAAFNTWVDNELVFVAESGGFETQSRSTRRGVVSSVLFEPRPWFLASAALSVTDAVFETNVPGISHHVPSVPPILFRTDVTTRGNLVHVDGSWLSGRVGVGYTFMSARHLTDSIRSPDSNILNAGATLRYTHFEFGVETYNLLNLEYADSAEYYVSNLNLSSQQQLASFATHLSAAPPRSTIFTLTLHL